MKDVVGRKNAMPMWRDRVAGDDVEKRVVVNNQGGFAC